MGHYYLMITKQSCKKQPYSLVHSNVDNVTCAETQTHATATLTVNFYVRTKTKMLSYESISFMNSHRSTIRGFVNLVLTLTLGLSKIRV